ncbi:MAG TPA: transposase [Clostridia bacterium]
MPVNISSILKRIYIRLPIIFVFLYVIIWAILLFVPYKSFGFVKYKFQPDLVKLHVHYQAVTGPSHRLKEDENFVKQLYEKEYPQINTQEIELKGNLPYYLVSDPMYFGGDMYVYGKFNGVTDEYKNCGSGTIPVFKVKYYDATVQLFYLEIFTPLIKTLLYISPIFVILLLYLASVLIVNTVRNKRKS